MQRWEHYTISCGFGSEQYHISDMGRAGWELVAVTVVFNTFALFFKRPLKD